MKNSIYTLFICLSILLGIASPVNATGWIAGSSGCKINQDSTYQNSAIEMAQRVLGEYSTRLGCISTPWLEANYNVAENANHAGLDFRARTSISEGINESPLAFSILSGKVVRQALSLISPVASTLVIESELNGVKYKIYYLHCSKHYAALGETVERGQVICRTGNVGAPLGAHLHVEIKKEGTPDYTNNTALSGSHCGGWCDRTEIIEKTIDPVDIIETERISISQARAVINKCWNRYFQYIGLRDGNEYISGDYLIQPTGGGYSGNVIALAMSIGPISNDIWYYWDGWQNLPTTYCY